MSYCPDILQLIRERNAKNRYPYGNAGLPNWKPWNLYPGVRCDPSNHVPKIYVDDEIRTMKSLMTASNLFRPWANFKQYRLHTVETIFLQTAFDGIYVDFNLEDDKGHPNFLDAYYRPFASSSKYSPFPLSHSMKSLLCAAQCTKPMFLQQNLDSFPKDSFNNKKLLHYIVLNLFEDVHLYEVVDLSKPEDRHRKKAFSKKESQLIVFFCCCRYKQLNTESFYELFSYLDKKELDLAIQKVLDWLYTDVGRVTIDRLRKLGYFGDYLEPLYRLLFSTISYYNMDTTPDDVSVLPESRQ